MNVSIITVCKNAEKTVERAIQSVISQTYPAIEYLVIDGQSEDNTSSIIERYLNHVASFISEPDSGVYQAMNKGIRLATGDWLYFVNADDYLFDATVIQDLVEFVAQHPDCDFVYGDHEARLATGEASIYRPAPPERMLEEMVTLGECMIQPACFFKADLFTRLGLFDETYRIAADYEWFARLLQAPDLHLCYYPRTLVSYAHGGLSGNIPALFQEVFAIQNNIPLYQQELWLSRRMQKLQQSFIEKYDLLERTHHLSMARLRHIEALEPHVQALEAKLRDQEAEIAQLKAAAIGVASQVSPAEEALRSQTAALQGRIEAMESSKFWKLRQAWFQLKRQLGLPVDNE